MAGWQATIAGVPVSHRSRSPHWLAAVWAMNRLNHSCRPSSKICQEAAHQTQVTPSDNTRLTSNKSQTKLAWFGSNFGILNLDGKTRKASLRGEAFSILGGTDWLPQTLSSTESPARKGYPTHLYPATDAESTRWRVTPGLRILQLNPFQWLPNPSGSQNTPAGRHPHPHAGGSNPATHKPQPGFEPEPVT